MLCGFLRAVTDGSKPIYFRFQYSMILKVSTTTKNWNINMYILLPFVLRLKTSLQNHNLKIPKYQNSIVKIPKTQNTKMSSSKSQKIPKSKFSKSQSQNPKKQVFKIPKSQSQNPKITNIKGKNPKILKAQKSKSQNPTFTQT